MHCIGTRKLMGKHRYNTGLFYMLCYKRGFLQSWWLYVRGYLYIYLYIINDFNVRVIPS